MAEITRPLPFHWLGEGGEGIIIELQLPGIFMIQEADRSAIVELADRYGAGRVLLFGSSADPSREARDIDLAVEGVAPADFFKFYGDLMVCLSKPVDLVDLSRDSKFTRLIRRDGIPIYG